MKKILIYLALAFIILGVFFIYVKRQSEELSYEYLHKENDLVFVNLPDIKKNFNNWSGNTTFREILKLEGLNEITSELTKYSKELEIEQDANLAIIVRENGNTLFALEHEMDESFLSYLSGSGNNFTKKINGKVWNFLAKDGLLLASQDATLLKNVTSSDTTFEVNWNHLFIEVEPTLLSKKLNIKSALIKETIDALKNVCHTINFKDNRIVSSGFDPNPNNPIMKSLKWQGPVAFDLKDLLPLKYNSLKVWQFNDGETYIKENKLNAASKYFDYTRLAEVHFNDVNNRQAQIVLLQTDATESLISTELGSMTVVSEGLKGYNLYHLKDKGFITKNFGSLIKDEFEYVAFFNNHAIFSKQLDWIKSYIQQKADGQVWVNSNEQMKWVENELIECNYLEINKPNELFAHINMSETIGAYFKRNEAIFKNMSLFVHQQSVEKNGLYSGITVNINGSSPEPTTPIDTSAIESIDTVATPVVEDEVAQGAIFKHSNQLLYAPKYISSSGSYKEGFIVFDNKSTCLFVSSQGTTEWKYTLEGSLVSSIYEVDLYKNGKIQYLFATDKKVYCLDRLGKLVENFPITLANRASINSVNVLDYENNKNYRFSITSGKNVWLYDSKGKSLDAWNPKAFSSNVIETVDHFRIQSLDYLLVKEENGTVHLLQRNSNEYTGYPIKQLLKWNGTPLNLSKGSNAANSFITMIAQDGVLKKYSLAGKDLFQGKLSAKDINSKVAVDDSRGHIYYAASSPSKTYVYDANLAQKFTYASSGKTLVKFQYYRLGAETVYVFHYKDSAEIINAQGKVLLNNIKTKDNVVMLYQSASKSTDVYYIEDKSLKKVNFSF